MNSIVKVGKKISVNNPIVSIKNLKIETMLEVIKNSRSVNVVLSDGGEESLYNQVREAVAAKFPVVTGDIFSKTEKEAPKERVPHIILDIQKVYTSTEEALQALIAMPKQALPDNYRNSITNTFTKGSAEGQIFSMYQDYKRYGDAVLPKIREFLAKVSNPLKSKLEAMIAQGKSPDNLDTFTGSHVNTTFFKFVVLTRVAATN